jgi:cyclic pyranopterin phosphate synthase
MEEVMPSREVISLISSTWPLDPVASKARSDVAQRYRYRDGQGELGVISSVTEPFCGDCSRLRLTADGKLHTCLFARQGYDLREVLRAGADREELVDALRGVWRVRSDRYSELRSQSASGPAALPKKEMSYLGG